MYIHKEGRKIIGKVIIFVAVAAALCNIFLSNILWILVPLNICFFVIVFWSVAFFRVPTKRVVTREPSAVVSSADGEVVAIEETTEDEYFHDKRIQISVFMSAYNVHVNWYPFDGIVSYHKYHPGKKLFAINPKSSELNERNSLALRDLQGREVMLRQVAGVMARRIVCNVSKGDVAVTGEEFGMIKFGSRVDFFLPLNSKINVKIGDKVKGKITILGYLA